MRIAGSLAALAAALVLTPAAWATFPGANGRIAFIGAVSSTSDFVVDEFDLLTMEADGTDTQNLTADIMGDAWSPAWSADGGQIAYFLDTSGSGWASGEYSARPQWSLNVANADGSGKRVIETLPRAYGGAYVAWSPDATRLAYAWRGNLFVIGVDGSGKRLLASYARRDIEGPAWSPDGSRVAFISSYGQASTLQVVDAAGGIPRRISSLRAYSVDWSPDGTRFVVDTATGIHTLRVDGSEIRRILPSHESFSDTGPRWSPDGTRIVLASDRWRPRLATMNPDGRCPSEIPGFRFGSQPDWQPLRAGMPFPPATCADLAVSGSVRARLPLLNRPFPVLLRLTNRGNRDAEGIRVEFRFNDPRVPDPAGAATPGCSGRRIISCQVGTLQAGGSRQLRFRLIPREAGFTYLMVNVTTTTGDPDRSTNFEELYLTVCSHKGTNRADTMVGTRRDDYFCAFAGADRIRGGGGNDWVIAGAGNDVITLGRSRGREGSFVRGGTGHDLIVGGPGVDFLSGEGGNDRLEGGPGYDQLCGGSGIDLLSGGPGPDELIDGPGRDQLYGEAGNDWFESQDGQVDYVNGGPGRDRTYGDRFDRLVSTMRDVFLIGGRCG
jgi:RTX calcium-binding nonapeptide repeat (4 copies)/WD40-like Beta Propeller Repeat